MSLKEIAEAIESPPPYTAKILNTLVHSGILLSGRGPHGGFVLDHAPEEIRLIEIINSIEGIDRFENCMLGDKMCSDLDQCPLHHRFHNVRALLLRTFYDTYLSDVDEQKWKTLAAKTVGELSAIDKI